MPCSAVRYICMAKVAATSATNVGRKSAATSETLPHQESLPTAPRAASFPDGRDASSTRAAAPA